MATQPPQGDRFVVVAAAGTTVASDIGATLKKVILSGTYVGSVEWYNSATAAGTAATNKIFDIGLPLTNLNRSIDINAYGRNGLVVVATGTPTLTYTLE